MASNYGLIDLIGFDGSLNAEDRMSFLSLAKLYEADFKENLKINSLELDDKYKTNDPVTWQRFLNHSSIKQFIENYLYEIADKVAMVALGAEPKNANAALKVAAQVDKKRKKDDNRNIVVMLLPQKEEFNGI